MFRPIMGLAGLNQVFSQLVNCDVFLLAWAESTVYATSASRLCGPKLLLYSSWKVGYTDAKRIKLFFIKHKHIYR